MSTTVSGPLFERAKSGPWESVHRKDGGHYNNFGCSDADGMKALRDFFPDGKANRFNVCLFSTSGIHGMYTTIEEAEAEFDRGGKTEEGDETTPQVTFLIVQPRICTVRHGNCNPESKADFEFLKKLRQSSWDELLLIGKPE